MFLVGEQVTLSNTFTVAGTPTDPTTISLAVTTPAGVTTTYTFAAGEITRTGAGAYTKTIVAGEAGTWVYVWTGTGAAADIAPGFFNVAAVGPSYIAIASVREHRDLGDAAKFPNARIASTIDWFEATFEDYTRTAWLPRTRTVTLEPNRDGTLLLPNYHPRRIVSVRTHTSASAYTDFTPDDLAGLILDGSGRVRRWSGVFTPGTRATVTYEHGADSPEPDIERAARIAVVGELLKDRSGRLPYSVAIEGQIQWFSKPGPGHPFGNEDVDEVANRRAMVAGGGDVVIG